jgi:flagellar biosynthesis/type III secretory pathway protein FliH
MKSKSLATLSLAACLLMSVSCQKDFDRGFAEGKAQGYDLGHADGYSEAKAYFATADYNNGYSDGQTVGYNSGYAAGQTTGYNSGYVTGYNNGYTDGDTDGYNAGYNDGYTDGYNNGYTDGDADGYVAGYDNGYDDGFTDGYDIGFDDGWYAAGGFSLSTKTASSLNNPYARMISSVSSELVDFSKIPAPKLVKGGIVANGKMIFEETSLGAKDLERQAASVEGYLVDEMTKQISNLGLSLDRSFKIAKLANHWRKFSSSRQVTTADSNAFAQELVGTSLASMEEAMKAQASGDSSEMNDLLSQAASANGTTPEHMSVIMNKLFF